MSQTRIVKELSEFSNLPATGIFPTVEVGDDIWNWIVDWRGGRLNVWFPVDYPFKPCTFKSLQNSEGIVVYIAEYYAFLFCNSLESQAKDLNMELAL